MAPGEVFGDSSRCREFVLRGGSKGDVVTRGSESSPIESLINCFWSSSAYCRI